MLHQLHIENFAIINSLDLDLFQGMTVVTGETGAGKSIIMDALGMVLGDRADANVVPPDAEKAVIVASFDLPASSAIQQWLKDNDLDADGECLLKRTINSEGRSKAFINGQPTTLSILRTLAEQLVDIHGQHAHHALLKTPHQLSLLDEYARHPELVVGVALNFSQLQKLQQQHDQLINQQAQRADRKTLLLYQLQELDNFAFTQEEQDSIEAEHHRLANGQQLQHIALTNATALCNSDSQQASVSDQLDHVIAELEPVAEKDTKLRNIASQLKNAVVEIEEASRELKDYGDSLELDPERLVAIEERLATWHDLARKHQLEPSLLIQHHQQLQLEFQQLNDAEESLDELQKQLAESREQYFKNALKLTKSRKNAAKSLENAISSQLKLLGMQPGKLQVEFVPNAQSPSANGLEKIVLMFQPNPGLPAQPLNKIASGGELSRISLAIQVVTVSQQSIPLMVFDEVDVGIGGGTAEVVGQLLKSLAQTAQVLCITHQPQVAAQGNHHLLVEKSISNGNTTTQLLPLSTAQKTTEIARMLGGLDITATTIEHAKEMLGV